MGRKFRKEKLKTSKTSHWTLTIDKDNTRNSFIPWINILEYQEPSLNLEIPANNLGMASALSQKPSFMINWDYFQWLKEKRKENQSHGNVIQCVRRKCAVFSCNRDFVFANFLKGRYTKGKKGTLNIEVIGFLLVT